MFHFEPELRERLRQIYLDVYECRNADWWQSAWEPDFRDMVNDRAFNKSIRATEHDFDLLAMDLKGKQVMDSGSGAGMFCVMLALLGAAQVYGVDIWEPSLKCSRGIVGQVLKDQLPIQIAEKSAEDTGFPDASFDAVFCREAISHFHDPYAFLDEAARILKPGGKLFLSDGNNGLNPWVTHKTYKIWQRFEKGPRGRCYCHSIGETMEEIRRSILRREFPDLPENAVELLMETTFGLTTAEIVHAAKQFKDSGVTPESRYAWGRCPVDPDTGIRMEMLFSPRQLAGHMRKCGLDARIHAYFSHGRHPAIAAISRALEKVSFASIYLAPTFQIVATKRSQKLN